VHEDEGADILYDIGGELGGDEDNDHTDLDGLQMPAACTRGISCLSMCSVRTEDGLGIELDDSGDKLTHSIARVAAWMGKDDDDFEGNVERCAAQDIENVTELVVTKPSSSKVPADSALSSLPLPKTCGLDWAAFKERSSCFNTAAGASSSSGLVPIPKLSREVLIEGMEPRLSSPADIKKQKIARYLEKRQRRLLKRKKPYTSRATEDVTYQSRRDIANKRARINGRFVCTSEFGQAPRRRH
jgi:hypothetical protein